MARKRTVKQGLQNFGLLVNDKAILMNSDRKGCMKGKQKQL